MNLWDPIWSYGRKMSREKLPGPRGVQPRTSCIRSLDDHRLSFNLPVRSGERIVSPGLVLSRPSCQNSSLFGRCARTIRASMRRAVRVGLLLLGVFFLDAGCNQLDARDGRLFDEFGREVLYHGVNARVAGLFDVTFNDGRQPVETVPPFGEVDCRFLSDELGMNVLRLPVNWSGVEPQRGVYDQAYIQRIVRLVDECFEQGVSTLIDFHQDAWSKEIGEDGAPLWAIIPPPTQLLQGPLTDLTARRLSEQALNAALSFFENVDGLQDAFAAMAQQVARALHGHPGAIGMDLMNEPLLIPGIQSADAIGPIDAFYRSVGAKVREVAPRLTLFYEPNSIRNLIDHIPVIGPFPLPNVVYAPHIYTGVFSSNPPDLPHLRASVAAAQSEAMTVGGPLFVGEWGTDPRTPAGLQYLSDAMQAFDEARASWTFWVYEEVPPAVWGLWDTTPDLATRTLRTAPADTLARPFPQAVDGELQTIQYDPTTRVLSVTITPRHRGLPHRFSAPRRTYPDGVRATCDGREIGAWPDRGHVLLACEGSEITLAPR